VVALHDWSMAVRKPFSARRSNIKGLQRFVDRAYGFEPRGHDLLMLVKPIRQADLSMRHPG
jgi:hypothetical protein